MGPICHSCKCYNDIADWPVDRRDEYIPGLCFKCCVAKLEEMNDETQEEQEPCELEEHDDDGSDPVGENEELDPTDGIETDDY